MKQMKIMSINMILAARQPIGRLFSVKIFGDKN